MTMINVLKEKLQWMSTKLNVLTFLKENWKYLVIALLTFLLVFTNFSCKKDNSQIIPQSTLENTQELAKELNLSEKETKEVRKEITKSTSRPPYYTYNVRSNTTQEAAEAVKKSIENGTAPKEVLEKSDKTIITPKENKVDVYKVNLEKKTKIKVGAQIIDSKTYPTIALEHKDIEVLYNQKGVGVMYTIKKW